MVKIMRRVLVGSAVAAAAASGALATVSAQAPTVKVTDPTSVVMIVNRDSNDIGFMDIKTKKMIANVFLGNNVNPHMVMMSPDGRYVVTGGTRANKAYIIDARTLQLVKTINVDIAPEHLSFSPDSRWYYQGNPDGDSISVIDMVSLTKIKTIPGFAEPLNVTFLPDGSKAYVGNYGAHWVGVVDVRRHEHNSYDGHGDMLLPVIEALELVATEPFELRHLPALRLRIGRAWMELAHYHFWHGQAGLAARAYGRAVRCPGLRRNALIHLAAVPTLPFLRRSAWLLPRARLHFLALPSETV